MIDEPEKLETELENMLLHFREATNVLNMNRGGAVPQETLKEFARKICESSKKIDTLLNKETLFNETEEELDMKIRALDEENEKSQARFEKVKQYSGI